MQLGNPIEALHHALAAATFRDLPDIHYTNRDWDAWRDLSKDEQAQAIKTNTTPTVSQTRRPQDYDVQVIMFPQTWGSTALGYGGLGGAAMTSAYTVVVQEGNCACVYFGGERLAYRVHYNDLTPEGWDKWNSDLAAQNLSDVASSAQRYKRKQK